MESRFEDSIRSLANKARDVKDTLETEEATKMSLVVPMLVALGYDVFNPDEVCPEYVADVGIKKGEKVDYAILENGSPKILIECKAVTEDLDKHGSQLFRYFATSSAKFGLLTNGIVYRFYTDLYEVNKMDSRPFLEVNLLDLQDSSVTEMKKFCKSVFDETTIISRAEELMYSNYIKTEFLRNLEDPSDDFVRFVLNGIYDGSKTQKVVDKFKPLVKTTFKRLVDEMVARRLTNALESGMESKDEDPEVVTEDATATDETNDNGIVTTEQEMETFYIIRGMLAGVVPVSDITFRDAKSYFAVLYKDNNRYPICRINLDKKQWYLMIPDAVQSSSVKSFTRYDISNLDELYKFRDQLISTVKSYLGA